MRLSAEAVLLKLAGTGITPPMIIRVFLPRSDRATEQWMQTRGIEWNDIMAAAWFIFLFLFAVSAVIGIIVVFLFAINPIFIFSLLLAPLVGTSLISNSPKDLAHKEEKAMASQSPRIVACVAMCMQSRPNIERAITTASNMDDGPLAIRLRGLRWTVMTRGDNDTISALLKFNSHLGESNQGLRQSLHLIVSANYERTRIGLERLLDKANQVVLEGTREMVDRYASSLSLPTMVLFSIGIILPVMLFALLPLASMGGLVTDLSGTTGGSLDEYWLGILLLMVFPGCCLFYARSILSRNPVRAPDVLEIKIDPPLLLLLIIWAVIVLMLVIVPLGIFTPFALLAGIVLPPCIMFLLRHGGVGDRNEGKRVEGEFSNALYQMGNRMLTGSSLEVALQETATSMQGSSFSDYAGKVLYLSAISSESIYSLLSNADLMTGSSRLVETAMGAVAEAAKKDCRAAGKVALNLAQNINDLRKGEARMEERLRGVVDMMRSTALFFAPLVLGITASLFGLIGMQTGQPLNSMGAISFMVGFYLIELGVIVSYFTTFLLGEGSWVEVGRQFSLRAPMAVIIFALTSLLSMNGMMTLI